MGGGVDGNTPHVSSVVDGMDRRFLPPEIATPVYEAQHAPGLFSVSGLAKSGINVYNICTY